MKESPCVMKSRMSRRRIILRRRKIVTSVGLTLLTAGFTCILIFGSIQVVFNNFLYLLAILGTALSIVGVWMINSVEKVRQEENLIKDIQKNNFDKF